MEAAESKRPKQHYHHHHRLREPVTLPSTTEPVVQDEGKIDHLMNRSIGKLLKDVGFDFADPAAMSSFQSAAEERM